MAQLPPKVPRMGQNWPDFCNQKMSLDNLANNNSSLWIDDTLDVSLAHRGSHRRSISDSVAFLEAPMVEEYRRSSIAPGAAGLNGSINAGDQFESFDDMQLMLMFSEGAAVGSTINSCSNASSPPSDFCDVDDDDDEKLGLSDHLQLRPKNEPEEIRSSCKFEEQQNGVHVTSDITSEKIFDPKRIKRILANRQSAQKSRVKKLQYISELERSVNSLEVEVSVLSPRVAFLDHQRLVLNVDNGVLKQRIAALAQDRVFKDAHQEALKREIERLRQIHYQQTKKMEISSTAEKEQLPVN